MNFEFATATRIIFGSGKFQEIGALAGEFGGCALAVVQIMEQAQPLFDLLAKANIAYEPFLVSGEPSVEVVRRGVEAARAFHAEMIITFGGGSATDSGKAIGALVTNEGEILDYLEVIGRGQPIKKPPLPVIAIPTTAGTGAEVTRNAVLASPEHHVKVSMRSPLMLPRIALIDPELTLSAPPAVTASTGMDALTQVIEPYLSSRANPLTDALCREAIARGGRSLRRVYQDGSDKAAREDMAIVSLFGGLALANAGLGAVHGFAAPLGGMYHAPHGAICAILLPPVLETNLKAMRERAPQSPILSRFDEVARLLTGDPTAAASDGVQWVTDLCRDLKIPALSTYGITAADFPKIVENAAKASSMKANPIPLTPEELTQILQAAL